LGKVGERQNDFKPDTKQFMATNYRRGLLRSFRKAKKGFGRGRHSRKLRLRSSATDAHGPYRGHEGVREGNRILKESLPGARFEYYNILIDGELVFLEWRGFSDGCEVNEGADSFIIRDGRIVAQTIHYKVHKAKARNKFSKVLLLGVAMSAAAILALTQKAD